MFYCPCCGYETLDDMDGYDICPVCFWEDDPVQLDNPNSPFGANAVPLWQARINYELLGVSDVRLKDYVRAPIEPRDPKAPYPIDQLE